MSYFPQTEACISAWSTSRHQKLLPPPGAGIGKFRLPSGGLLPPHPAATEVAPVSIGHNAAVRSDVPRSATRKHLRLQCYGFVRIPTMMGFYRRLFVRIHMCPSPAKANNAVRWKVPTIWGTLSERTHSVFTRDDLSNCADVHVHDAVASTYRAF